VILGAPNFGVGSSREQAAEVLKHLGIAAVIAPSFAGIFYRNAINLGLPVFTLLDDVYHHPGLSDGAELSFDFGAATLTLVASGEALPLAPLPIFLRDMILDGGLIPHLEKRFQAETEGSGAS
jgi:3-isopropylmalate/(R)-2-methylmalate dehydratase small subunit